MMRIIKGRIVVAGVALSLLMAVGQTQSDREVLSVEGYEGQANVIRDRGRVFVDAQELARITNGSLTFEKDRIILTLPRNDALEEEADNPQWAFSRPFMRGP